MSAAEKIDHLPHGYVRFAAPPMDRSGKRNIPVEP
jgi:hypothetical protein